MTGRTRWLLCGALLLTAVILSGAALLTEQRAMAEKLIRLHVVANSDSDADQAVKLQVRDAVLEAAEGMDEAELRENLPRLREAARDCLRQNGVSHPVTVSLRWEDFPTRHYGTFSLPAGRYEALRVTIGAGEGHNWWCVVFPSICFRAAAELEEAAVSAGFTDEEIRLITEDGGTYQLKFKLLELLARFGWFSGGNQ